ncbi:MAG: ribonuclease P protein component [Hellea sp.]|nr:ribonuclease P protein component [Hellea sp.]
MITSFRLGQLKKRSEFLFVRNGKYRAIGGVVIQMRENPDKSDIIRVGFTATKKIGGAVQRNRAKRRLRACARELLPQYGLAGHDYVFIARDKTNGRNFEELLGDVKKALLTLAN